MSKKCEHEWQTITLPASQGAPRGVDFRTCPRCQRQESRIIGKGLPFRRVFIDGVTAEGATVNGRD